MKIAYWSGSSNVSSLTWKSHFGNSNTCPLESPSAHTSSNARQNVCASFAYSPYVTIASPHAARSAATAGSYTMPSR